VTLGLGSGELQDKGGTALMEARFDLSSFQPLILDLAQGTLTGLFAGKRLAELECDASRLDLPPAPRVNVTLRNAGTVRGSMSATGSTLGRQIVRAAYRAALDSRFDGPLTRCELPHTTIEVWIQIASSEISHSARFEKNAILLGIEGVEIEGRGKTAYYKPSVPITSGNKTITALLEALCKKARLEKDAWRDSDIALRKTQWISVHPEPNGLAESGARPAEPAAPLSSWIAESATFLIRNQDVSGDTAYFYNPIAGRLVPKRMNLVRASGCLFALARVLEAAPLLDLGREVVGGVYQMARGILRRTSLVGKGERIVPEQSGEEPAKLGATALLAAALGLDPLRTHFPQEYGELYRSIVLAQKADGRFCTRLGETQERPREIDFFPGQALLVLALEAERGNADALARCQKAYAPYAQHFRTAPASAFVGWNVDVWTRLARLTQERAYADFAFEQADWLLQLQVRDSRDPREVGGFVRSGNPPGFSSIVFLEATVRALELAVEMGEGERVERYSESVRLGLQFCRRLRLEETPSILLGDPMRCRGGVALSLVDRTVRCDVVQHFITLCLALDQGKAEVPV
jgi:AMMECR1 domain-containing protein